jgi:hypothetical protein
MSSQPRWYHTRTASIHPSPSTSFRMIYHDTQSPSSLRERLNAYSSTRIHHHPRLRKCIPTNCSVESIRDSKLVRMTSFALDRFTGPSFERSGVSEPRVDRCAQDSCKRTELVRGTKKHRAWEVQISCHIIAWAPLPH